MKRAVRSALLLLCLSWANLAWADEKVTIWWAQWEPAAALQELGNDFEAETGIAIEVKQIPWPSYQDQVFLNFGNNKTDFDIVMGQSVDWARGY